MAAAVPRVRFQASLVDAIGVRGSVVSHLAGVDPTKTMAEIAADLAAWAVALDGVTTGGFEAIKAEILPPLVDTGAAAPYTLTTSPDVDSRMNEVGNWSYSVYQTGDGGVDNPYRYTQAVQALADTAVTGSQINDSTAVAAWEAILLAGALGGHFANLAGQHFHVLKATFLGERKHRKQLNQHSRNVNPS